MCNLCLHNEMSNEKAMNKNDGAWKSNLGKWSWKHTWGWRVESKAQNRKTWHNLGKFMKSFWCHSSGTAHLFLRQSLPLVWSSLVSPSWQDSKPQKSTYHWFPGTEVTGFPAHAWIFKWMFRIPPQVLMVAGQALYLLNHLSSSYLFHFYLSYSNYTYL